jgi:hypothetical protein
MYYIRLISVLIMFYLRVSFLHFGCFYRTKKHPDYGGMLNRFIINQNIFMQEPTPARPAFY